MTELVCQGCGQTWEHLGTRGALPKRCKPCTRKHEQAEARRKKQTGVAPVVRPVSSVVPVDQRDAWQRVGVLKAAVDQAYRALRIGRHREAMEILEAAR